MREEIAYCIGCGCNDDYGCDAGCSWLRLNRSKKLGVCSECEHMVSDWDGGKRGFSPEAEANLFMEEINF